MQKDNVTPIRDGKGKWQKGVSGNPSGVSSQRAAIRELERQNEVILKSNISALVGGAVKLHRALLTGKQGKLTVKEMIQIIELTYRYGIDKSSLQKKQDDVPDFDVGELSEEDYEAMMVILEQSRKDATSE